MYLYERRFGAESNAVLELRSQVIAVRPNQREVEALLCRVLPVWGRGAVVPTDDGCDYWAFDVNRTLIVRVRKERDEHTADAIEREAALLNSAVPFQ